MTTYGTAKDGRVLDEATIDRLAAEAEAGFPGVTFVKPKTGRPWMSSTGPARTRTIRLPRGLDTALIARAEEDQTTPSEVIREALRVYLASA